MKTNKQYLLAVLRALAGDVIDMAKSPKFRKKREMVERKKHNERLMKQQMDQLKTNFKEELDEDIQKISWKKISIRL